MSNNGDGSGANGRQSPDKTSKRIIQAGKRAARAVELRLAGWSLQEIADEVGYASPSGVYIAILKSIQKLAPVEAIEQLRWFETQRLDILLKSVWYHAKSGDPDSIELALKIMARKAKLYGLEIHRHEISGPGGEPLQLFQAATESMSDDELRAITGLRERCRSIAAPSDSEGSRSDQSVCDN